MSIHAAALIEIHNLSIAFRSKGGDLPVVRNVDLTIRSGETAALVGESGSGKTLLARSIVDLMPPGATITNGTITFDGATVLPADSSIRHTLRGRQVGYVFQEPLSSLNPALRIGIQLVEGLRHHQALSADAARAEALEMLERLRIASPDQVMQRYPHELSGGMRQRVMIAAALIMKPALLIADEPTTALDTIIQSEVIGLLKDTARAQGTAVLMVTHDLSAVAGFADTVSVMSRGEIVEAGRVDEILRAPRHPYTRALLAATLQPITSEVPSAASDGREPLIEVRDLSVAFPGKPSGWRRQRSQARALDTVSFGISPGEALAIIGQSGSGKTTLARAIAGLQPVETGEILFRGAPIADARRRGEQPVQFIFQDPFGSLDPRMKIGAIVEEALKFDPRHTAATRQDKVAQALDDVRLGGDFLDRFPHQLSGGQRQRVSIARAIVRDPQFIIADEPVSALDLTVQAQILQLFLDLKAKRGFACLFVSHDLGVVEHFADRIGVLFKGRLVEIGPRAAVFDRPHHAYTRALLSALSHLEAHADGGFALGRRDFGVPAVAAAGEIADASGSPRYVEVAPGHLVAMAA
jgi:peptide/nickel transport system ATP-binding protein